jgi:hypothetical protein
MQKASNAENVMAQVRSAKKKSMFCALNVKEPKSIQKVNLARHVSRLESTA